MEGTAFVFAVVEFVDEASVSVIHKSWIESSDQGIYCYWPPTSANISSRVRKAEIPDKAMWGKYKIRVFNYTDDYDLARTYASKAVDTSNVESKKDKRSKKRPRRYSDSSDSDEIDLSRKRKASRPKKIKEKAKVGIGSSDNEEVEEPTINKLRLPEPPVPAPLSPLTNHIMLEDILERTPTPTPSSSSRHRVEDVLERTPTPTPSSSSRHREEDVLERTPTPTPSSSSRHREEDVLERTPTPTPSNSSRHRVDDVLERTPTPTPSSSSRRSDSSFQVMVLQKLNAVIENQKALASSIKQISSSGRANGSSIVEDLLPQPLTRVEQIERLREALTDEQYKKKMVLFLTSQGGHDFGDCLRRMMKKIGSNRLWAEYSLRGQKQKKAFEQHPICKIVMKCCLKVYPKTKISEMEEVLIDFLKQAPHKKGGPKYKEPKTPRTPRTMTLSDSD